jgi:hypothetical protein
MLTGPSAVAAADSSVSASPRSGQIHVEKECSQFASGFCTITASDVEAVEIGSTITYLQPDQVGSSAGSPVVLDLPGPGNNKAYGNCSLASNVCTFSGGTGKFTHFSASVSVSYLGGVNWGWAGTYSFKPGD